MTNEYDDFNTVNYLKENILFVLLTMLVAYHLYSDRDKRAKYLVKQCEILNDAIAR